MFGVDMRWISRSWRVGLEVTSAGVGFDSVDHPNSSTQKPS